MISKRNRIAICSAMCTMFLLPTCASAVSQNHWVNKNNGWQYVDNNNNALTGWQQISGKWYYLGESNDGTMKTGWKFINGNWYYLGEENDGAMQTGWKQLAGEWYYFGGANDGAMKIDWQEINGKWYYFGQADDGMMKSNQWINEYYVGEDGAWIEEYSEVSEVSEVSKLTIVKKGGVPIADEEITLTEKDNFDIITNYIDELSVIDVNFSNGLLGGGGYSIIIEYKNGTSRSCYFSLEATPDKQGYIMNSNGKNYKYSKEDIDKIWNDISKVER